MLKEQKISEKARAYRNKYMREYMRVYREKNREQLREQERALYKKNPEKFQARQARYWERKADKERDQQEAEG